MVPRFYGPSKGTGVRRVEMTTSVSSLEARRCWDGSQEGVVVWGAGSAMRLLAPAINASVTDPMT